MTIFVNDVIRVIQGLLGGSDRTQRPDGIIAHTETSQGNGANLTDDVLCSLAIPATALNNPGTNLELMALGHFAANANNKQVKVWFGPDVQTLGAAIVTAGGTVQIGASGVVTGNNVGWQAMAEIIKTGAYLANTQKAQGQVVAGATHTGTSFASTTFAENAQQFVTITGASSTTGAANDVILDAADVYLTNGG